METKQKIAGAGSIVALFIFFALSSLPSNAGLNELTNVLQGTNCTQFIAELNTTMNLTDIKNFVEAHNCQLTKWGKKIQSVLIENQFFIRLKNISDLNFTRKYLNKTRINLITPHIDFRYNFGTKNKLKNGKILDAGILTLTKTAVINPSRSFKYSKGQLKIKVSGNRYPVKVGKIYYLTEENYTINKTTYIQKTISKEFCYKDLNTTIDGLNGVGVNRCSKYTYVDSIKSGTKIIIKTHKVKKYDYWNKLIEAGKDNIFYVDLRRTTPVDAVEVYFETFGYKDKEHSWWNSAKYYQIINTTMMYATSSISSTLTDFVAYAKIDTTNSTVFNTTDAVGLAFTLLTDNSTQLNAEYITGWGTSDTWFNIGNINQTSSIKIVAWADNSVSTSVDYNVTGMWSQANYYAVYHAEDAGQTTLLDSTGNNNDMTMSGTCTNSSRATPLKIGGAVEDDSTCYYGITTATGLPTGSGASTETVRSISNSSSGPWSISYALGNPVPQVNDRAGFFTGHGGQQGYGGYIAQGNYYPRFTEQNTAFLFSTRYNGGTKFVGLNTTYYSASQALSTSGTNLYVAGKWGTQHLNGVVDEIKFATVSRTDDWIKAEFALVYNATNVWEGATAAPTLVSSILNSTSGTEFFTENTLYGWGNITDTNSGNWNITCTWFMNDSQHSTEVITEIPSNTTGLATNVCNITSGVAKHQNWILQQNASNATDTISKTNSTQISISNTAPQMSTLTVPASAQNNTKITASATATDADNDTLTYYYQFSNASGIIQAWQTATDFQCNATACPDGFDIKTEAKANDGEVYSTNILNDNTSIVANPSPVISNISIFAIPTQGDAIECNATINSTQNTTLIAFFEWHKDGVNQTSLAGNTTVDNATATSLNNLSATYTDVGDKWACKVRGYDGTTYSEPNITQNVTVSLGCGTLGTPGKTYTMVENLSTTGATCFAVSAQNITLDCAGYTITGNNSSATYGVYSDQFNTTVKNCVIKDFQFGIWGGREQEKILNNTVYTGNLPSSYIRGINLEYSGLSPTFPTYVSNSLVSNNTIFMYYEPSSNAVGIQVATTNIGDTGNNTITNNTIFANITKAYGISNTRTNNNFYINNTITLENSASGFNAYDIKSSGENMTIDCLGATITGSNTSGAYGVYSTLYTTTVKNCNINNFAAGVFIDTDSADYANITNNTINLTYSTSCSISNGACNGIFLKYADNAAISNNTISTSQLGINLYSNTNYNTIQYNNVSASYFSIYLSSNSNNTVQYNNAVAFAYAIELYSGSNNTIQYNNATAGGSSIYLRSSAKNNTVQYNNASASSSIAIRLDTTSNNNIVQYNNASASNIVIRLDTTSNNNITNNNLTATDDYAIYLYSTDNDNNLFTNNTLKAGSSSNARTVIYIPDVTSDNNTFYYNNLTGAIWVNNANETNYFNTTNAGNIYYFANGTASWDVYDIYDGQNDNWADAGIDYPFSNTTLGEWLGSGNDSHPYTTIKNDRPTITATAIKPTEAYTNDTLICNATAIDLRNSSIVIQFEAYKNDTKITAYAGNKTVGNNTNTNLLNISSTDTAKNNEWICAFRAYDGWNYSNWVNSSTLTILNSPPTIPTSDNINVSFAFVGNTISSVCAGSTDPDTDAITYYYRYYNINDSAYRGSAFVTDSNYTILTADDTDTLRVDCYANDTINVSSTRNGTDTIAIGKILNITLGTGITEVQFLPNGIYDKRVEPTNQTTINPLFQVVQTISESYNLTMYVNESITGLTTYCDSEGYAINPIILNESAQTIFNASINVHYGIWCWRNYSAPSKYDNTIVVG